MEQGVRSVLLTSGTLSPLKPFISELGIPIAVQLENPHIVTKEQVCVGVLSQGPDNHPLNSSYNTRCALLRKQNEYFYSCCFYLLLFLQERPKVYRVPWKNSLQLQLHCPTRSINIFPLVSNHEEMQR